MTAPLAWLREAYERRDGLAAQGIHITLSVSAWGVTIWAAGQEPEIGRSWAMLESASVNPLIPTIDTVATKIRRAAA